MGSCWDLLIPFADISFQNFFQYEKMPRKTKGVQKRGFVHTINLNCDSDPEDNA